MIWCRKLLHRQH